MIHVQFSDATEAKIISYFGSPQDPEVYPNQGQIEESDIRYAAFYQSADKDAAAGLPTPTTESAQT